jgi:hypothetical protein
MEVFDVPTAEELINQQRSIWEGDWEVLRGQVEMNHVHGSNARNIYPYLN